MDFPLAIMRDADGDTIRVNAQEVEIWKLAGYSLVEIREGNDFLRENDEKAQAMLKKQAEDEAAAQKAKATAAKTFQLAINDKVEETEGSAEE